MGVGLMIPCVAVRELRELKKAFIEKEVISGSRGVVIALEMAIESLEREDQGDGWVPTSDRLPDPKGHKHYLVTEAHFDPSCKARYVMVDEYEARDTKQPPYWTGHKDGATRVVAWRPMPKPYRKDLEPEFQELCPMEEKTEKRERKPVIKKLSKNEYEEKETLRTCPFCNGDAEYIDIGDPDCFEDWGVRCKKCGVVMLHPGEEGGCITTKEQAMKAWNRRFIQLF